MAKKSKKDIEEGDSSDSSDSSDDESSKDSDDEGELKDISASTAAETILLVVSIVAVGLAVGAMVMAGDDPIVYIAGIFCLLAPYSWKLQRSLTDIVAMLETNQALTAQVEALGRENELLQENAKELGSSVEKLNDVEGALDAITNKQGQGVESFKKQIEEGKILVKGMKKNLRGNVLQSLLGIVMASDEDGDFSIDAQETDRLVERLHEINGVELREDKFRAALIKSGGSLDAVMDMVRDIVKSDDVDPEDQIFIIGES